VLSVSVFPFDAHVGGFDRIGRPSGCQELQLFGDVTMIMYNSLFTGFSIDAISVRVHTARDRLLRS
jgi:hypothetical protein